MFSIFREVAPLEIRGLPAPKYLVQGNAPPSAEAHTWKDLNGAPKVSVHYLCVPVVCQVDEARREEEE